MNKLFNILEKLTEKKVWYSFQSESEYYHLIIVNPEGVKEIQGYHDFEELEYWLTAMWGHILKPLMPAPPNFPMPR